MIYLFLSILFSSLINVIFRLFNKYDIDNQQAITFNYFACVITGLAVDYSKVNVSQIHINQTWVWLSLALGALFIVVFLGMAITARKDGISVSVVASKMGVIFPVVFATLYLDDSISIILILGIILSLASVFLTSRKSSKKIGVITMTVIPLLVFIGSGTIDTALKIIELNSPVGVSETMPVLLIFISAAVFGLMIWLFRLANKSSTFSIKNLVAGILLGIPNYFSIYFLFMALRSGGLQTAQIFPVNNVGVVLLSTLLSILIFREQLSKVNYLGLALAIISILLIAQQD